MEDIKFLKKGDIVEGVVYQVTENTLYLDVQAQTEGKIHLDNYGVSGLESFVGAVKVGDVVRAKVQKVQDDPTLILLSRLPLLKEDRFQKIESLVESGEIVTAKVKQVQEKGLILSYLDHELFLPYSLLDFELQEKKDTLKNQLLNVNIIEVTKRGKFTRIVASRKIIFEREKQAAYEKRQQDRQQELEAINTGDLLEGTVEKIEKHAANVRFNHVVGLLRISQVSHHRIEDLSSELKVGQKVQVKVIKKEGNRLDLSMKVLQDTPFIAWAKEHQINQNVKGTVFQKLPFGLIIELAPNVRGLLHKNEYAWNPNDNFDAFVKIGDEVELLIVSIDQKKEKIQLSKKLLQDNPWKNVTVKRGDMIKAPIQSIDKEGLYVEVQGVLGLIPTAETSADKISKLEDYFAVGDEVECIVTDVLVDKWVLKLSIRRLLQDQERASFEKYLNEENQEVKITLGDLIEDKLDS